MLYLMTQIATLLTLSLLLGLALGWLAHCLSKVWSHQQTTHLAELEDLRRHYSDLASQNGTLRQQLKQAQATLRKVRITPSEADYGEFLQVRKALEHSRAQYQALLEQYHAQQQQLEQLQQVLQHSQQEFHTLQAQVSSRITATPVAPSGVLHTAAITQRDDLTCLHGVSAAVAKKLEALGICSYRQLAEFNLADIQQLHTLLGTDLGEQPEQWIQEARQRLQATCAATLVA